MNGYGFYSSMSQAQMSLFLLVSGSQMTKGIVAVRRKLPFILQTECTKYEYRISLINCHLPIKVPNVFIIYLYI